MESKPTPTPAVPDKPVTTPQPPVASDPVVKAPAAAATPAATAAPKPAISAPKAPVPTAPPAPAAAAKSPAPAAAPAPAEFKLPPAVYSPALVESVMYDIQYYLDWVRQNQIRKKVGAAAKEEPTHSAETVLVIEAWLGGKPATLESLEALLDHLKKLKLPQVHVMLAALPNRLQREALVGWFRANVEPGLLMSFVADRNLGGGIVVRTPNRVFDLSWKQQLVEGRSKLAEILKRV